MNTSNPSAAVICRAVTGIALASLAAMAPTVAQAQTKASLRGHYIVQLVDAPLASYDGSVAGYAATRPLAGAKFRSNTAAVQSYATYLATQRNAVLAPLGAVPVTYRYAVAFNGFAASLTAAQLQTLRANPAVAKITADTARPMDTTRTTAFLGLSVPGGLWSKLDAAGRTVKGEDVIVGVVDSGVWPENPAFSDKVDEVGKPVPYHQPGTVVYGAPPARWTGSCVSGPGFVASQMCNNKLIGAKFYRAGLDAAGLVPQPGEYVSPRDADGHGTHTASTAAGNDKVDSLVGGVSVGSMSGMAPRARVATYKVCWDYVGGTQGGCFTSDNIAAIDDAVSDGVDVINYSISGTLTDFLDPVENAFFNAAAAGVFVAASAGNGGPGNTVAHMSPWLTTVAASTHDRASVADLTLGNGNVYTGASINTTPLPSTAMVLSSDIGLAGLPAANVNLCFLNSLDPTKAAGKIVVCDRGTNDRVEKSAEVKRAGGVGMVLINPTNNTVVPDAHSVPTVHLQNTARTAVRAYVAVAGATGSIGSAYQAAGVVAPVMASFSSRGPNLGNVSILKPDITAPGVDVIAGLVPALSQAQHDAVIAGTFTPPPASGSISGTSMSSPHIAGIAALVKQLHPTWSPAAIKSALMTSAGPVLLASGATDVGRFGYGSGHVNPNGAAATNLVYDAGVADYSAFLCGIGALVQANPTCQTYGSIQPWNLNLASLTGEVVGKLTLRRTVTNRGPAAATYVGSASLSGYTVSVVPSTLTLPPGQSASFNVNVTRTSAALGAWVFGELVWSDGTSQVKSPLTVRGLLFSAPFEISDSRATGTKLVSVTTGYEGRVVALARALVAAQRDTGTATTNSRQCYPVAVPAGTLHARFALFNADTAGGALSDLDLEIVLSGSVIGSSGTGTSDERVDLVSPAAGAYSACVVGYAPAAGSAAYTVSSWVVGSAGGVGDLRAAAAGKASPGGTASVGLRWSAVPSQRSLGLVDYSNGSTVVGRSLLSIDATGAAALAPLVGNDGKALANLSR